MVFKFKQLLPIMDQLEKEDIKIIDADEVYNMYLNYKDYTIVSKHKMERRVFVMVFSRLCTKYGYRCENGMYYFG